DCVGSGSGIAIPRSSRDSNKSSEHSMNNRPFRLATIHATGESFDELALPHLAAASRLARWLMRHEHDPDDVVQEASQRALRYVRIGTVMSSLSRGRQAFRDALDNQLKQSGIQKRTHPREQEADAVP